MMQEASEIRQLMDNPDLYREKMEGKQFLLGRFELSLNEKLARKAKRPKKIAKSKFREMLVKQTKPFAEQPLTYQSVLPMNKLWNGYMKDLLEQEKNEDSMLQKILKADLHGGLITVAASKTKTYVGLQGIVLKQSLRTFEVMTKDDRLLRLLKKNSVFLLHTDQQCFKLYGCNLVFRPADRVKHKFKSKAASDFILRNL